LEDTAPTSSNGSLPFLCSHGKDFLLGPATLPFRHFHFFDPQRTDATLLFYTERTTPRSSFFLFTRGRPLFFLPLGERGRSGERTCGGNPRAKGSAFPPPSNEDCCSQGQRPFPIRDPFSNLVPASLPSQVLLLTSKQIVFPPHKLCHRRPKQPGLLHILLVVGPLLPIRSDSS